MRNIKLNQQQQQNIEAGSSALGNFFCLIIAGIVIIWLCHDTSAGLTASLHHVTARSDTGFWPLDIIRDWL